MRALLLAAGVLAALTSPTLSQRPSTLGMTCAEAEALVASRGAVVLSTGQYTYDRFVEHVGHCSHGEETRRSSVPTSDGKCRLYVCKPRFRDIFD